MECRDCGVEFKTHKDKPGYINQCADCATDVQKLIAEQSSSDDGVVESMTNNPISIGYLRDRDPRPGE